MLELAPAARGGQGAGTRNPYINIMGFTVPFDLGSPDGPCRLADIISDQKNEMIADCGAEWHINFTIKGEVSQPGSQRSEDPFKCPIRTRNA